MKSDWWVRAEKFMEQFIKEESLSNDNMTMGKRVRNFNQNHHRVVKYAYGQTRHCLMTSDYVIKWDRTDRRGSIESWGGCVQEYNFYYTVAEPEGYEYLFARPVRFKIGRRWFYAMPRIDCLAIDRNADIEDYLSDEENEWIYDHCWDLHDENWGFLHGEVQIIDYATGH